MPEAYVRGNTIKYLRVPEEVIDKVKEESHKQQGNLFASLDLPVHGSARLSDIRAHSLGGFGCVSKGLDTIVASMMWLH